MNREERIKRGKSIIEEKIGFIIHLGVYLLVNGFFIVPDAMGNGQTTDLLVLLGWGIGIVCHFLKTFIFNEHYVDKLVEKKMNG